MLCSQIYLSKVIKKNLLSLDCNKYKAEQDYWWIQETNVSKLDLITFVRWMVSFILLYHFILKDIYLDVCVCVSLCLVWDEYRMHTRVSYTRVYSLSKLPSDGFMSHYPDRQWDLFSIQMILQIFTSNYTVFFFFRAVLYCGVGLQNCRSLTKWIFPFVMKIGTLNCFFSRTKCNLDPSWKPGALKLDSTLW